MSACTFVQDNGARRRCDGGRDNVWHPYAYTDSNNSRMTLCYTRFVPTVETYCGWGSNLLRYSKDAAYVRTADFNDGLYHGVIAGF